MTDREKVIENIKKAVSDGDFHRKVELNDPVLTREEKDKIVFGYLKKRKTLSYKIKSFTARRMANVLTSAITKTTEIKGLEKLQKIHGGAIVTSNHFSPTENTAPRLLAWRKGKKRLNVVCEETNLAMSGIIGFLMNYADTIPITDNLHYMQKSFTPLLKSLLDKGEYVLIYPEREMWTGYRKPRPLMEGAYYFASKLSVPIVPCFVEIRKEKEKVVHTLHVLDPLFPNPEKSVSENCRELASRDYEMKVKAYEEIYNKKLDYSFEEEDVVI
ncbi:MAG: 1-acyl-sn-glycerol-3-phosphate acyltransferase [Clostridia bacterium]|nr:1-acyl-sn-glycerol-3-phosphate acyltransferase [Clostridia bacterium]